MLITFANINWLKTPYTEGHSVGILLFIRKFILNPIGYLVSQN